MDRFTILKTNWEIAIFYKIKENLNINIESLNIDEIAPQVFLNMNNKIIDDLSFQYLKAGVKSIVQYIKTYPISFSIEELEYNICDYQPEGMYYMFRKWFFESQGMEMPPINVEYNKEKNIYIFPNLTLA